MSHDVARAVADAVLFEGYALYPYRPSSRKNASRWQFGVVAPRAFAEADGGDPWFMETQCLVEHDEAAPRIAGVLRFLRLRRRRVRSMGAEVPSFEIDGRLVVAWDEGDVHELPIAKATGEHAERFELQGDRESERAGGVEIVRTRESLRGTIRVRVDAATDAGRRASRISVRIENETPWDGDGARDDAMARSLLGAHLLLSVEGGAFVSLIDPPDWARAAAGACKNARAFPVLVGEKTRRDRVLAAPIILYDYPEIAPESPGDLFDATEIDEILTLRTRTLTDAEKREARAADPRVARIIDRADSLGEEDMARLHGAFREAWAPGDRVVLHPGARRTDAQDMFLEGMRATVKEVKRDVEGRLSLAVTVDEDPAADLHGWHGRYHYFYEDEVERLTSA
jgi:hypothetical protein